jgi:hypothetical protein
MEVQLEEEIHVNIDCDNVMDWQGKNLKLWNMLRSKVGARTELFQITGERAEVEESLAALVAVFRSVLRSTAMTSRSTVLDTRISI